MLAMFEVFGPFVEMSAVEVVPQVAEPLAMLLWGAALLLLCSVLQRTTKRRSDAHASKSVDEGGDMNGVPTLTAEG